MKAGGLIVLLACLTCSGQESQFVYPVPAPTEFRQRSVIYKQTPQTALTVDLFLPSRQGAKLLPLFMIYNG